ELAERYGTRFTPPPSLIARAERGESFEGPGQLATHVAESGEEFAPSLPALPWPASAGESGRSQCNPMIAYQLADYCLRKRRPNGYKGGNTQQNRSSVADNGA